MTSKIQKDVNWRVKGSEKLQKFGTTRKIKK